MMSTGQRLVLVLCVSFSALQLDLLCAQAN